MSLRYSGAVGPDARLRGCLCQRIPYLPNRPSPFPLSRDSLCGFATGCPHRVAQREHTEKIDDEIIAQIRRSRLVVADFSLHRAGVYYEAGFAKGLGLEVFFTCRKEDLASLHFDVLQSNTIDWQSPEELRQRLAKRIEAVLGRGPIRPRAEEPE